MPLDNSSLTDKVTQKLRDAIINLEHLPGQHLTQAVISEKYGVSHIPAREALMKLESEGYVKQLPYRGAIIMPFSNAELDDMLQIRIALETLVMKEAIEIVNAESLHKMERTISKLNTTRNPVVFTKAHNDFYNTMFNVPSRPYWMHLYQHSNHRIFRYFAVYLKVASPASIEDAPTYQDIFESYKKKDANQTLELLAKRYYLVVEIMKNAIQKY